MHAQSTVVGFLPCSDQSGSEYYGFGICPTSTTVIDMSQWNYNHKSCQKRIQAVSHFNNQCKSCLCWSQWPCSPRQRFWPPDCWDRGFESHFGLWCFSLVFVLCCPKKRPCNNLIPLPRSPAIYVCQKYMCDGESLGLTVTGITLEGGRSKISCSCQPVAVPTSQQQ